MYCGEKNPPPAGKTRGTPSACFKKGIAVGFAASKTREKVKVARVAGEAAATARLRKKIPKPTTNTENEARLTAMRARVANIVEQGLAQIRAPPRRIQRAEAGTQTSAKRQTASRAAIEAAATAKGRSQMRQKVVKEGLPALKNELRLDALGMAELQSLAKREHAKNKFAETWSKYTTKEQFKNLLSNRGYSR